RNEPATTVAPQDSPPSGPAQNCSEGAPCLRKNLPHTVEKPLYLLAAAEKDPAQHEPRTVPGVGRGIIERQCRAPGAAEDEPSLDAEGGAQMLDVGDEM